MPSNPDPYALPEDIDALLAELFPANTTISEPWVLESPRFKALVGALVKAALDRADRAGEPLPPAVLLDLRHDELPDLIGILAYLGIPMATRILVVLNRRFPGLVREAALLAKACERPEASLLLQRLAVIWRAQAMAILFGAEARADIRGLFEG